MTDDDWRLRWDRVTEAENGAGADVLVRGIVGATCDNRSAALRWWNTREPLTHSSDLSREGLAMDAIPVRPGDLGRLRRCSACEQWRDIQDYSTNSWNGKRYGSKVCRPCQRIKARESSDRFLATRGGPQFSVSRKQPDGMTGRERHAHWATFKMQKGCADCGRSDDWRALQFDHRPGEEKSFTIGEAIKSTGSYSDDEIATEIAKCDVVCADCHVERTRKRRAPRTLEELAWALTEQKRDSTEEAR